MDKSTDTGNQNMAMNDIPGDIHSVISVMFMVVGNNS